MELSKIKNKIEEFKAKSQGLKRPNWPEEIKEEITSFYDKGYSVKALSSFTGIAHQTIATWTYRNKRKPKNNFKQVKLKEELKPEASVKTIKINYKKGLSIEGLSIDDLRLLLSEGLL